LDHAVAFHALLRVADWLWHAASIPAFTPGHDIIALPLAYDIIALRPQPQNGPPYLCARGRSAKPAALPFGRPCAGSARDFLVVTLTY
jgi:hypothetical protein